MRQVGAQAMPFQETLAGIAVHVWSTSPQCRRACWVLQDTPRSNPDEKSAKRGRQAGCVFGGGPQTRLIPDTRN